MVYVYPVGFSYYQKALHLKLGGPILRLQFEAYIQGARGLLLKIIWYN